jgi:hypothetical protein
MSVSLVDGAIRLEGDCPVEEAERLLQLLLEHQAPVDLSGCGHLHAALLQVLLAARPPIRGIPADSFVRDHLLPLLKHSEPAS